MADEILTIQDMLSVMKDYRYNPDLMINVTLTYLENVMAGKINVVDPTNPMVFLLEASAVNTVHAITHQEALLRRQYASLAQNREDLYYHMTDQDYLNRFAIPTSCVFTFAIPQTDLDHYMIEETVNLAGVIVKTGVRKITLPRNMELIVQGVTFSIQYPVDIVILPAGAVQITQDTTVLSPFKTLSKNVLEYGYLTNADQQTFLCIKLETDQFFINSQQFSLSLATRFEQTITLTDFFYAARVYYGSEGNWTEIDTTHSAYVYDRNTPTAILSLGDHSLVVTIPLIYLTNLQVTGSVRVDVYETRGELNLNMASFSVDAFKYNLKAIDSTEYTAYVSALEPMSCFCYATSLIQGGQNETTFDELKRRVIANTLGNPNIPIVPASLADNLLDYGLSTIKNVDTVTDRIFLATRRLPLPFDDKLITAASATITTLKTSLTELALIPEVYDHGNRLTLPSSLIYQIVNGIGKVLSPASIPSFTPTSATTMTQGQAYADTLTAMNLFYSPFYYVLDSSTDAFDFRAYFLEYAQVDRVHFIEHNASTDTQCNTLQYQLMRSISGFTLSIAVQVTGIENPLLDLYGQLSFIPQGESTRAYLNGTITQAGTQTYLTFNLGTSFDITADDEIILTGMTMAGGYALNVRCPLTQTFDLVYGLAEDALVPVATGYVPALMDHLLAQNLLSTTVVGITHEEISITLGQNVKNLWCRARSVISDQDKLRYLNDVPAFYTEDVYEVDAATGTIFSLDNGNLVYTIIHHAGDPILDSQGQPTYLHRRGELIYDESGNSVISQRSVERLLEITLIDGLYHYADDPAAVRYRGDYTKSLYQWLTQDLATITSRLLDNTRIYFYPAKTSGVIKVAVADDREVYIEAAQSLQVVLYVNDVVLTNPDLRNNLKVRTIKTIFNQINQRYITRSMLVSAVHADCGRDVISVSLSGLGGSYDLDVLRVLRDSESLSIKKKLSYQANQSLIVTEAIDVQFKRFV